MRDALASAGELSDILENLLELSRSQSDRLLINKEQVDIAKVVAGCIDKVSAQSTHKFTMDIPADIPMVKADRLRIGRVVYNLIGNAIKYSPAESEIKVFAYRQNNFVVVGIADEGPGISKEDQKRLFKHYERLAVPELAKGVGLGLVVCKHLVEAHGGEIWVESEPGKGSTFYFTIPL
jgi:signal transduction histidine kinase